MLLFLESENLVMHFCRKYFRTFVVLLTVYDLLASMWKIKVSEGWISNIQSLRIFQVLFTSVSDISFWKDQNIKNYMWITYINSG